MNWNSVLLYAFINYLEQKHLKLSDVTQKVIFDFTKELNEYADLEAVLGQHNLLPSNPSTVEQNLRDYLQKAGEK